MLWNPFFKTGFCRGTFKFLITFKSNPSTSFLWDTCSSSRFFLQCSLDRLIYVDWLVQLVGTVEFMSLSSTIVITSSNVFWGICFFGATEMFCALFLASFAAPTLPVRFDFCFLGTGKFLNFVSQLFCAIFYGGIYVPIFDLI